MIEWYGYGTFRHTREQTIWAIRELFPLRGELWPKEPDEYITEEFHKDTNKWVKVQRKSTYIDLQGRKGLNILAPYIKAKDIYIEITDRLETTKDSGEALVHEIQHGLDDYELLSPPAKRALNYISGWRRRKMNYASWRKTNRYRFA